MAEFKFTIVKDPGALLRTVPAKITVGTIEDITIKLVFERPAEFDAYDLELLFSDAVGQGTINIGRENAYELGSISKGYIQFLPTFLGENGYKRSASTACLWFNSAVPTSAAHSPVVELAKGAWFGSWEVDMATGELIIYNHQGDVVTRLPPAGGGGGSGGVTTHNLLAGRDAANQHPIEAITGLSDELSDLEIGIDDEEDRAGTAETALDGKITAEAIRAGNAETALGGRLTEVETELPELEKTANKVEISSSATDDQYPTAKSVYEYGQDILALIPAGGLKIPLSLAKESDLPTADQADGDYYYIQDMDVSAPGRTGRAWWNSSESTTTFLTVIDQYQSMDGLSIIQTGGGEWEVSTSWLEDAIADSLNQAVSAHNTATTAHADIQSAIDAKLPKSGGQMTGTIVMDGSKITALAAPEANTDAATKAYVDNAVVETAAQGVVPNYAAIETINRITVSGGEWTADRNGYVYCSASQVSGASPDSGEWWALTVTINGKIVHRTGNYGLASNNGALFPVIAGDLVKIQTVSGCQPECYFVPARFISSSTDLGKNIFTTDVLLPMQVNDPYKDDASVAYTMNDNPYQMAVEGFLFPFPTASKIIKVRTNISNSGWNYDDLIIAAVKIPTRTEQNPHGAVGDDVIVTDFREHMPPPTMEDGVYQVWDLSKNPLTANAGDYIALGSGNYNGIDKPIRLQSRQWANFVDGEKCLSFNFQTRKISYLSSGSNRRFFIEATYYVPTLTLEDRLLKIEEKLTALEAGGGM